MAAQIPIRIKASVFCHSLCKKAVGHFCAPNCTLVTGCFRRERFDLPECSGKSSFSHSIECFSVLCCWACAPN